MVGCTGTGPFENPCITNPSLPGCSAGNFTSSLSIDTESAPTLASNLLHDLLDVTQIALMTTQLSSEFKQNIQDITDTPYQDFQGNCGTPPDLFGAAGNIQEYLNANSATCGNYIAQHTVQCDNNNTFNVNIMKTAPGYALTGTIMQIVFNDRYDANGTNATSFNTTPDPTRSCQLGRLYLGGTINIGNIIITDDPLNPGNWTQTSDFYPTVTVYDFTTQDPTKTIADSDHWIDISNPMRIESSFSTDTGLSFTGTVMDNSAYFDLTNTSLSNLNGIEFSHYPAYTDPNDTAMATYNNLRVDSTISAQLNNTNTVLSYSTTGTMSSNRTGIDLDMDISTADASDVSQPLTWLDTNVFYAPKDAPPSQGAFKMADTLTGSQLVATINPDATSTENDLNIVITDNTLPVNDPSHVSTVTTGWLALLMNRP